MLLRQDLGVLPWSTISPLVAGLWGVLTGSWERTKMTGDLWSGVLMLGIRKYSNILTTLVAIWVCYS